MKLIPLILSYWLIWSWNWIDPVDHFEVWHSSYITTPNNFSLFTTTTNDWLQIYPLQENDFFIVRAVDNYGNVSDWATK